MKQFDHKYLMTLFSSFKGHIFEYFRLKISYNAVDVTSELFGFKLCFLLLPSQHYFLFGKKEALHCQRSRIEACERDEKTHVVKTIISIILMSQVSIASYTLHFSFCFYDEFILSEFLR